jgi:hypothetical protein
METEYTPPSREERDDGKMQEDSIEGRKMEYWNGGRMSQRRRQETA